MGSILRCCLGNRYSYSTKQRIVIVVIVCVNYLVHVPTRAICPFVGSGVIATIEPNWKSNCVYRQNNVALMRIVVYGHELLPIAARITSYHITACVVD